MDSVRFGKALGMGARHAAKALVSAADAAASPRPGAGATREGAPVVQRAVRTTGETAARVVQTQRGVARGSKQFRKAVWGPFVKVSGVLWLEVTGVFFGLFLLPAVANVWKLRGNLRDTGANHAEHVHLEWSLAMVVLFGYFCVSSFVRARRRSR